MAEVGDMSSSLLSLEEELTCSICLCPFQCPVTIPCGHNFCQDCLLATWTDNYSCPQCRMHFTTKPELKKNTVLSTVVETFMMSSSKSQPVEEEVQIKEEPKPQVIVCDTCMEVEAVKTCLTCMASFCEEHVRPHRENPIFGAHQLSEPLGDLHERICPDHHKLMDFFCVQHGRCICSFCLQQVHKGCQFSTPDEQRALQESDMRNKLSLLDGKIVKNQSVLCQMKDLQNKLKDSASSRKRFLESEYRQMRELLDREEREAMNTVDLEQESGQTKLQGLMKKFDQNVEKLSGAKDGINNLLSQSQSLAFLQATVDLPSQANFDPYTPKVNLDSKVVTASQAFAAVLKEHLLHIMKQPIHQMFPQTSHLVQEEMNNNKARHLFLLRCSHILLKCRCSHILVLRCLEDQEVQEVIQDISDPPVRELLSGPASRGNLPSPGLTRKTTKATNITRSHPTGQESPSFHQHQRSTPKVPLQNPGTRISQIHQRFRQTSPLLQKELNFCNTALSSPWTPRRPTSASASARTSPRRPCLTRSPPTQRAPPDSLSAPRCCAPRASLGDATTGRLR